MNIENFFSSEFLKNSEECERYEEFLTRIFSFQKPDFSFGVERFYSSESVGKKVENSGGFRHFFGDTVVFDLEDSAKRLLQEYYISPLYQVAPDCLAEKLKESTLHMTLHDLNASDVKEPWVMEKLFDTEIIISEIIKRANIKNKTIKMITTCVFNMVNTSLVLGLRPKSEEDYYELMSLYFLIENFYPLPYRLTPHITLAYYSRFGFEDERLKVLQNLVNELNGENFEITLSTDRLYYQKFTSMNEYFHIMPFVR